MRRTFTSTIERVLAFARPRRPSPLYTWNNEIRVKRLRGETNQRSDLHVKCTKGPDVRFRVRIVGSAAQSKRKLFTNVAENVGGVAGGGGGGGVQYIRQSDCRLGARNNVFRRSFPRNCSRDVFGLIVSGELPREKAMRARAVLLFNPFDDPLC